VDRLELPPAPNDQIGPVRAWAQPVTLASYLPMAADKNPIFLENRIYQGSRGKVYPLPFTDRISEEKVHHQWEAVHLENQYVRLMILPQLGGRIQIALDKTNNYDFIYRQNVIKPALVGLAGPWISGGIEFNWPQHHRPSTFMRAEPFIESHADGSRTVWLSEHEPMNRMKGMHGVCLHPDKSFIELKVRLYNRTPLTQTFLWWANVATRVHEYYQSFFPPDVFYVADHARRATSSFPLCDGLYYGVDYARREREGVPAEQRPREFVPPGTYAANDLSWYANIPVPTSYMCMGSGADFFGGYDHAVEAGIVHVASHHIAPGKKQWTWGNHEFGYAWDRNLTDADGPYIELMAGVYTDNQPDFSFLHPFETRTFSQYWYPIQKIGPAQNANLDAAVSLSIRGTQARIGVSVTSAVNGAHVEVMAGDRTVANWPVDLAPGAPLVRLAEISEITEELRIIVRRADHSTLIEYQSSPPVKGEIPPAATEPAEPKDIQTADELYLIGLHLEQYRHATRSPAIYWEEAIRRDPADVRCNNAMGLWRLRRGEFEKALEHFRVAVNALTARNPNPIDGEPFYNLGLALRWLGREEEAYSAFYKATWNYAWQSPAFYALAELDCRRGNWHKAIEHLDRSLRVNVDHLKARNLKAIALRKLGRLDDANHLAQETLKIDPFDHWAAMQIGGPSHSYPTQTRLDIALDCAAAGLYAEAIDILSAEFQPDPGTAPLIAYYLGYFHQQSGLPFADHYSRATQADGDYCFPARLEEMVILQAAIAANPRDAKAHYYLGNLLYDRRRHDEAIKLWKRSVKLDPTFSIAWRNLGIGYFNHSKEPREARRCYDRAVGVAPEDARLWYERDQLAKRLGESPKKRLKTLSKRPDLVALRDDLSVELAALYNQTGHHELARQLITARRFQPWEGGEGQTLAEHVRTHLALGRAALDRSDATLARSYFETALSCPDNIGEARHLLSNPADVHYWLGIACRAAGDSAAATKYWQTAATFAGDFQQMSVKSFSEMTYYQALSLRLLGKKRKAEKLLRDLLVYAKKLEPTPAKIDYFATSLPAMLLFNDDLQRRQTITAMFLKAQAQLGLGKTAKARSLLKKVLEMDGNHALAADLWVSIQKEN
jgi:tetratricopeptide (TPR) repeat protein